MLKIKNIFLCIIILMLANCTTTAKKFSKKKEDCKKLHAYFTQAKDCLGLSFQTYYDKKNTEYEKQHDIIVGAISDQIYKNIITNEQGWEVYEGIIKDFNDTDDKTKYLTNVIYRFK
ncbi:MAG: hypothetical protein ISQ17_03385, partial [Pelagibacteraceae bacterium]|nr:hypothetical protein [Pelagibacteraceae bacterium]